MAAALAFYAAFSIAPMLVIVTGIAGYFFGADAVQGRLVEQIQQWIGLDSARAMQGVLANAWQHQQAAQFAWYSLAAVAIGASATFTELQGALNVIWGSPRGAARPGWLNLLRVRAVSFGLVIGIAFLLLISLVLDAAIDIAFHIMWDTPGLLVAAIVQKILSFAVLGIAFAALLKVLPDRRPSWAETGWGAATATLLFLLGKGIFAWYLVHAGTANVFGAAGALAVLMMWLFFSSSAFLFGAEMGAARQAWSQPRVRSPDPSGQSQDPAAVTASLR